MEPKEEPPMERERLQSGSPGYTAGISAGADSKPTLTDEERAAFLTKHMTDHYATLALAPRPTDALHGERGSPQASAARQRRGNDGTGAVA